MKNLFQSALFIVLLMIGCNFCYAQQEKKPTIMLLPSDNWCTQRYFTKTFENQGSKVRIPDYERAFQEDIELKGVMAKVREILIDKGYSIKDCEQEIKNIATRSAEDNVTTSKTSMAMLTESPIDLLKRRVKSDIIMYIDWNIYKDAEGKSVTFILQAVDAYTSKNIASVSGTTQASAEPLPKLLEKSVTDNIAKFDSQMTKFYMDTQRNGREIVLTIRCWDSWDNDLETEYHGEELLDCIQAWMRQNTVQSAFNLTDNSENFAQFEQVRIPLADANGNALDARGFATQLRKFLAKEPYLITAKVLVRGLGEAIVVLGEK